MGKINSKTKNINIIPCETLLIPADIMNKVIKDYFLICQEKSFKKIIKDEIIAYLLYYYLSNDKLFYRR